MNTLGNTKLKRLWQALSLALLLCLVACESKPKKQDDPTPTTVPEESPRNKAPAKRQGPQTPRGTVVFSVQNADLKSVVLPLFQSQAGITIIWRDEARKVSLSFIEPVPWRSALDLLCRFYNLEYRQEGSRVLLFKKGDAVSAFNFDSKNEPSNSPGIKSTVSANGRASSPSSSGSSSGAQSSGSNSSGANDLRTGLNKVDNAIDRRTSKRRNP